jgi:protocatechuate 3,4-dioxygenase beta subunit
MSDPRRRDALQRLALTPLALPTGLTAMAAPALLATQQASAAARRPTPAQTEGPYYPVDLPADTDFDLLRQGATRYAKGQPCWLEGTVTDTAGTPLPGLVVEIWQCDADGHYRHPGDGDRADPSFQAFGRVTTDAQGRYRFRTIRPVAYTGRTPHIHLKVRQGRRTLLTTQVYVAGDPGNARDVLWSRLSADDRAALTVVFEPGDDGLRAVFGVVVDG